MGRPRAFDESAVIAAAMALFRKHGFAATSVRDLEAATGLKAPSLYHAFGDKQSLFALVLTQYECAVLRRRITTHLDPDRGVAGIRSFLTSTFMIEPLPHDGCLLANSAVEYGALGDDARRLIDDGIATVHSAFVAAIEAAQRTNSIDRSVDAAVAAQILVVLYQGQLLLLRTSQSHVDLETVIDATLAALLPPPQPQRSKNK